MIDRSKLLRRIAALDRIADPRNNAPEGERANAKALAAKLRQELGTESIKREQVFTPDVEAALRSFNERFKGKMGGMSFEEMIRRARKANAQMQAAYDKNGNLKNTTNTGDDIYWGHYP